MRFFLPITEDPAKAEYLWESAREMLADAGFPTEPRRFHSLFFRQGQESRIHQVGVEDPVTGQTVMLILRAAGAPFYWVCTPICGIIFGAPIPVPAGEVSWAVEFEAEPPVRSEDRDAIPSSARSRRTPGLRAAAPQSPQTRPPSGDSLP